MSYLDLKTTGKWFVLSGLTGLVAGAGAVTFQYLSQLVVHFTLTQFSGYAPGEPLGETRWFVHEGAVDLSLIGLLAVITIGGLVSGFLVFRFAPEAEGHGTDAAIEAYHKHGGFIRPRIPPIKLIASAITLGTGGSGGREGPIAQIGAGFGSFLATRLRLSNRDRRILLAAGMGAGVGAIFRAPLAGALFSAEILYRQEEIESEVIVPTALASIISYSVFSLSLPGEIRFVPLFGANLHFQIGSILELVPLAILAAVLSVVGWIYIKVFYGTHAFFKKLPIVPTLRPALGALIAGLIGAGLYVGFGRDPRLLNTLSTGYGIIQNSLGTDIPLEIPVLFLVAIGKIVTTSFTIGSGGSGGVFGPSMVIGGCLGGAVGALFHGISPNLVSQPKAYIIVGMAGFFAGCARAPISTLIMVSEMTGDYKLLLPVLWVSTLCFVFLRRTTIYDKQVPTRLDSPAHRGEFLIDLLVNIKVSEVYRPLAGIRLIPETMTLNQIVHLLAETEQSYFPVVDEKKRLVGIFSSRDVRRYIYDEAVWDVVIAKDFMVHDVLSVTPDDTLNTAMRRFTRKNIDELPVVDPTDPQKILGMLRRKEVIASYNERLEQLKTPDGVGE